MFSEKHNREDQIDKTGEEEGKKKEENRAEKRRKLILSELELLFVSFCNLIKENNVFFEIHEHIKKIFEDFHIDIDNYQQEKKRREDEIKKRNNDKKQNKKSKKEKEEEDEKEEDSIKDEDPEAENKGRDFLTRKKKRDIKPENNINEETIKQDFSGRKKKTNKESKKNKNTKKKDNDESDEEESDEEEKLNEVIRKYQNKSRTRATKISAEELNKNLLILPKNRNTKSKLRTPTKKNKKEFSPSTIHKVNKIQKSTPTFTKKRNGSLIEETRNKVSISALDSVVVHKIRKARNSDDKAAENQGDKTPVRRRLEIIEDTSLKKSPNKKGSALKYLSPKTPLKKIKKDENDHTFGVITSSLKRSKLRETRQGKSPKHFEYTPDMKVEKKEEIRGRSNRKEEFKTPKIEESIKIILD
jgi:hypothetical protein